MNKVDGRPDVNEFCYAGSIVDQLEVSLSRERFGTCLKATGEDRETAIRLQVRKTSVRGVFYCKVPVAFASAIAKSRRILSPMYGEISANLLLTTSNDALFHSMKLELGGLLSSIEPFAPPVPTSPRCRR